VPSSHLSPSLPRQRMPLLPTPDLPSSPPSHLPQLAPSASLYHYTSLSPNPLFLSLLTFLLPNLSSQPKFMTLSPKNGKRIFFTV
jgi:hypothetical protein